MKLITNTVEEAKQNIIISVKENFEPETVFDVTMKDIDERVVPNGIVNSKIDPTLIKLARTAIGTEVLLNGFKPSVDVGKPVLENGTAKASNEYYEDVSDEDEKVKSKLKENGVSNPKEISIGKSKPEKCSELTVDGDSEKFIAVNGCSSSGIEEIVDNKNNVGDKSEKSNIKSDGKDMLFEVNPSEFIVIDSVEVSTSEEDFDKSISGNDVDESGEEKPSTPKLGKEISIDEGSDTENDLEAKEKLLALLKETPPAQVIISEEEIETENISGSYAEEEKRLLSLLEDSQSECNLNLSNDTVSTLSISDIDKTSDDQTKTNDSVSESEQISEIKDSEEVQVNKSADNEKCNPIVNDKDVSDSGDTDDSVVDKTINKTSAEKSVDEKEERLENDGLEKAGVKESKTVEESMVTDEGDDVEEMKPLILVEEVNESSDTSKDKKELADATTENSASENIVSVSVDCEKEPIDKGDDISSNNEALKDADKKSDDIKCNSKRRLEDIELGTTKKLKRSTSCDGKKDTVLRKRTNSLDLDTKSVDEDNNKKFKPAFVKDPSNKLDNDDQVVKEVNKCDSITIDEEDESDDDGHQKTSKQDDEQEKESSETESVINSDYTKTSNVNDDSDKGKTVEIKDVEKVEDVKVDENNEPKVEVNDKIKDDSIIDSKDTTKTGLTAKEAKDSLQYVNRNLPLMKRIHKEKLKTLDKSDLEELIIQKICESIADRSVIGELRLKVRSLEKSVDVWRKKAAAIDKANRELKSIFNRYLKEVDDNIGTNNKTVVPIRITRSVGLQVAPPQVSEKSKPAVRNPVPPPPPKQNEYIRTLRPSIPNNRDPNLPIQKLPPVSAPLRTPNSVTPTPVRTMGPKSVMQKQAAAAAAAATAAAAVNNNNFNAARRLPANQHNEPPSPASVANKRVTNTTPPSVPVSAPNPSSLSDLEVIDLTDKDERTARGVLTANNLRILPRQIVPSPNPGGATLTSPVGQRMTYLVPTSMQAVQGNQRQQLILATTTTNGAQIRPVTTTIPVSRANNVNQTLTIPGAVIMKNGTVMPIQTQPANVAIRSPNPSSLTSPRRVQQVRVAQNVLQQSQPLIHPAPLPSSPNQPNQPGWLLSPPRPLLKVSKTENGIMLSWSMTLGKHFEEIASYQLYAYQENSSIPPSSSLWKKVGDVKALPLPMACTLTQFVEGHKYHFAVRAVDVHSRVGLFSYPSTILLK